MNSSNDFSQSWSSSKYVFCIGKRKKCSFFSFLCKPSQFKNTFFTRKNFNFVSFQMKVINWHKSRSRKKLIIHHNSDEYTSSVIKNCKTTKTFNAKTVLIKGYRYGFKGLLHNFYSVLITLMNLNDSLISKNEKNGFLWINWKIHSNISKLKKANPLSKLNFHFVFNCA